MPRIWEVVFYLSLNGPTRHVREVLCSYRPLRILHAAISRKTGVTPHSQDDIRIFFHRASTGYLHGDAFVAYIYNYTCTIFCEGPGPVERLKSHFFALPVPLHFWVTHSSLRRVAGLDASTVREN